MSYIAGTIFIFTAICGMLYSFNAKESDKVYEVLYDKDVAVVGEVVYIAPQKDYFHIKVNGITDGKTTFENCGKIRINVEESTEVEIRDVVSLTGTLWGGDVPLFYGDSNYHMSNMATGIIGSVDVTRVNIQYNAKHFLDITRLGHNIRTYLLTRIDRAADGETAAFLKALLAGDKSSIPDETKALFSDSGLSHIIAVSGLHLSVFISIFCGLFYFYKRRFAPMIAIILTVILYCFVTGGSPSVLRAGIMTVTGLILSNMGLRRNGMTCLWFSAALMCLYNPYVVMSISFQLSVLSTAGLFLFADRTKKRPFLTTLSVLAVVSPICAYYFNSVALGSMLGNIVASPIIAVLLPLGYLMCIIYPLRFIAVPMADAALFIIKAFGNMDLFNFSVPSPEPLYFIFHFAVLMLVVGMVYKRGRGWSTGFTALMLVPLVLFICRYCAFNDCTRIYCGKNMTAIETVNRKRIVIDNGGKTTANFVQKKNYTNVDVVLGTSEKTPIPQTALLSDVTAGLTYMLQPNEYTKRKYSDELAKIKPLYYNEGEVTLDNVTVSVGGDDNTVYCDGKEINVIPDTDGSVITYYVKDGSIKYVE